MSRVSIITASYNYEDYIKETIESVINQTFQDWEMIIVNDGSTDNSVNLIKEYYQKDSRIKLYQHKNGINKGLAETLQLGISKANSEWLAFLESDDTIEPDYLERKFEIAKKYPKVDFIFNDVNMFGDKEAIDQYTTYFIKQKKLINNIVFPVKLIKLLRKTDRNLIPTFSCVMVKKECLINADFNSPIKSVLDYYLWAQLAKTCNAYYIDSKLTNWRKHPKSYINAESIGKQAQFEFHYKRIEFLYSKYAYLRKSIFIFKTLRQYLLQVHINKSRKEIILLGRKIYSKGV